MEKTAGKQLNPGQFDAVAEKMRAAGLGKSIIEQFKYYYSTLLEGERALIPGASITSVGELPRAESPEIAENEELLNIGQQMLDHCCILKLNGGLGTSMGLDKAKSLLEVKQGLSFLDIIVRQCLFLRERHQCSVPLIFMNSFRTEADTQEVLKQYPQFLEGQDGLASSFIQNKVPRLRTDTLEPLEWPEDPDAEWCPPGHGDLYTALSDTGILDSLIEKGYRYLFVSNSDNLGAVMELSILGYFAKSELPFMMEVADRTAADKKGGHLAKSAEGGLLLREIAQCPPEESKEFQDIERYRYFNTNTLWINLPALAERIRTEGFLKLPLIINEKRADPKDSQSPKVYQLETAMGAAISLFENAAALRVSRKRFAPVKKTSDLLALRSDCYDIAEDFRITLSPQREGSVPLIELEHEAYAHIDSFEAHFPAGAPSLVHCSSLRVEADVIFGRDVVVDGEVRIAAEREGPHRIADGTLLSGAITL